MGYTKFCNGYSSFTVVNKLTNHLEHKPRAVAKVDWSGPTMSYVDTSTGGIRTVYLFVGTLPYSQYSYVEPCLDMKIDSFYNWVNACGRARTWMYRLLLETESPPDRSSWRYI